MTNKTLAEQLRELADTGWRPIIKIDGVPYYAADLAADALDAKDAEIARWKALLIERDGGNHDADCRIHNWPERGCSCGHLDVIAALRK